MIQTTVPKDKIGRITSIDFALSMAISPIGTLGSGFLTELFGLPNLIFICAITAMILTLIVWNIFARKKLDYQDEKFIQNINKNIEESILEPRLAYRAAIRTLKNFETSSVTSHEGTDAKGNYEAEAWFCSEAKVTGGRIITRIYVSEGSQSLEVRVWCGNAGQLTGFLAKIIELLFEEINIIRKIKSEEREKTIDVMAITQNLAEISDYCMLRWKAQSIRNKLHDTFVRLRGLIGDNEAVLGRIEFWLTQLNKYGKDDKISDEDADKLVEDVEKFKNVISRAIKL